MVGKIMEIHVEGLMGEWLFRGSLGPVFSERRLASKGKLNEAFIHRNHRERCGFGTLVNL